MRSWLFDASRSEYYTESRSGGLIEYEYSLKSSSISICLTVHYEFVMLACLRAEYAVQT